MQPFENKMSAMLNVPSRSVIEQLVRKALIKRMGLQDSAELSNPLIVNVSARHCHLTEDAVEVLFGSGHRLTLEKRLYQKGQFAAKETITLIGPRSRVISNLRILGPCRPYNQVELAYTDAIALGFDIPLRISGDIEGTPGAMLMGPAGFFKMEKGIIRALRHVHMGTADADFYKVKQGDDVSLRIGGDCGLTLEKMRVRVSADFKLEVHIDTDEGNACNLRPDSFCEILI